MYKKTIDRILDYLSPDKCYFCTKNGEAICSECMKNIIDNIGNVIDSNSPYIDKEFYIDNRKESDIIKLVDDYKFLPKRNNIYSLTVIIADFLKNTAHFTDNPNDLILVPCPTSKKHIKQRGFDHILLLVQVLSKTLNIKYQTIIKRKGNYKQLGASKKQRKEQALKSYYLDGDILKDKTYIIVDDIKTTGSTLEAIAKILKDNKASRVWALYILYQEK